MTKKICLSIIFIFILFVSCNKNNDENNINEDNTQEYHQVPITNIDSSMYPLIFNKYSYWVYQNANNENDSVFISNITYDSEGPASSGQGLLYVINLYKITTISSVFGEVEEKIFDKYISRNNNLGSYMYISTKTIGDKIYNVEIIDLYDSLFVLDKYFFNVTKLYIKQSLYINSNMNIYYVDSVGIIKKELIENDSIKATWNLLRYNVNVLDSTDRYNFENCLTKTL